MITSSTTPASIRFFGAPKVWSFSAAKPPPMDVSSTWISEMPMIITTIPDTRGVMMRRARCSTRESRISVQEATMRVPNSAAIIVGTSAPPFFSARPPIISGVTKLKLVPCIDSRPDPTGPQALICRMDASPEANSDMLIIWRVSSAGRPSAWQISSAGVMTATNIASRC